jgi:hypothetical protein
MVSTAKESKVSQSVAGVHPLAANVDGLEQRPVNPLYGLEQLCRVVGAGVDLPAVTEDGRHAAHLHVVGLALHELLHRRQEAVAVRAAVPEELHHLDLARGVGGLRRLHQLELARRVDAALGVREARHEQREAGEKREASNGVSHRLMSSSRGAAARHPARWPRVRTSRGRAAKALHHSRWRAPAARGRITSV